MNLRVLFVGILWSLHCAAVAQPIEPAPLIVETVECRGNKTTTCEFIKNKLDIRAGRAVDDDAVHSAQLRLSSLSNFKSVRVYLEKGSETGNAALIVDVVEASAVVTEYALGGGYGYADPETAIPQPTEIWNGTIGARVSNQNLFGAGKIAALSVAGRYETRDFEARTYNFYFDTRAKITGVQAIASYIDPNLLGTERFFLSLGAGYGESRTATDFANGDPTVGYRQNSSSTEESKNFDGRVSLGYRLWSYSYLFGGYRYSRSESEFRSTSRLSPNYSSGSEVHTVSLGIGWDSEDDAFFPTRGSRVSLSGDYLYTTQYFQHRVLGYFPHDSFKGHGALKSTWSFAAKSIVTLRLGGEPDATNDQLRPLVSPFPGDLGVTYSHALSSLGAERSRWYLHFGTDSDLETKHLSLGIRFESRVLGLVDLYATGTQSSTSPGLRTGPIMGN